MPTCWMLRASIFAICLLCSWNAMAEPPLKFQFGPKGNVRDQDTYDATRGYGFEPAAGDTSRFSVRVPEGNYRVTVRLGASDRASQTSVAAETRRLMLENVATKRGQIVERSFIVNVRDASLKEPETNA